MILLQIFLLLPSPAQADLGPKPTMEFTFAPQPGGSQELAARPLSVELLQCKAESCGDGEPLKINGPQAFSCERYPTCHALAYGFAPFQQIVAKFPDQERKSKVFAITGKLASLYKVNVRASDLDIALVSSEGDFPTLPGDPAVPSLMYRNALTALLLTIGAELGVLFVFLRPRKELGLLWPLLGWALLTSATFCALYLAGLVFSIFGNESRYWLCLGAAEAVVVLLEAVGFYGWMRRRVPLRSCLLLSLAANALSFLGTFVF